MQAQRGFTYIELTLVACIIAILAAIAVPNFLEAKVRAAVARSKAELVSLQVGIEAYRLEHRIYPLNLRPGVPSPADLHCLSTPIAFMSKIPQDIFTTVEARGPRHPRPIAPVPYRYLNGLQLNPNVGFRIPEPIMDLDGFVAAILWGHGPGGTLARRSSSEEPTVITPAGEILSVVSYDPTNGSASFGDLYLTLP